MFTKELEMLLETQADWDISSYRKLLVGISGTEKKAEYVQKKVEELLETLSFFKRLQKNDQCKLVVTNEDSSLYLLNQISGFINDFEEVKKIKKEYADIFKSNASLNRDYQTIESSVKIYSDIKAKEADFRGALLFYRGFVNLGAFSDSELKKFYNFINSRYNSKYNEFLPDDSVILINDVLKKQKELEAAELAAAKASLAAAIAEKKAKEAAAEAERKAKEAAAEAERKAKEAERKVKAAIREITEEAIDFKESYSYCMSECNVFLNSYGEWMSIADNGEKILDKYKTILKTHNLKSIDEFEKEYKAVIAKIVSNAKAYASDRQTQTNIIANKGKVFEKIAFVLKILWLSIVGAIGVYTIVEGVIEYLQSGMFFIFAIILGIVFSVISAALRIIALCGFGTLWWPNGFETLEFFDGCTVIINIVILVLGFATIIFCKKRDSYHLKSGKTETSECWIAFCLVLACIAFFLLRLVFIAVGDLVSSWHWLLFIFALVFGLVLGLFQCVMLLLGAGFWWKSLYYTIAETISPAEFNLFFYAMVICLVVFTVISTSYSEITNKINKR